MKRIYFIAVVLALSACSSQKYSNSHYQRLNNTDDAYFSPNDLKTKPKQPSNAVAERESGIEKYQPQNTSYYTNTNDETANPNAANRNSNPTQYTNTGAGSQNTGSQNVANPNSLQGMPQTVINVYNQPWGTPFSPFYTMPFSNSIGFNSWNNSWYIGPTFNTGWGYNPWGTWNANPWFSYGYGGWGNCNPWYFHNPYWGYNNWNMYNPNPWVYDPWINQWVYDPWGSSFWGYNQPFFNTPNYGGGNNTTYVRNAPRRTNNSFMPAVRNAIPNGGSQGGSRVIGATELQAPATNTRNAPAVTNTGPTVAPSGGTNNNNGNASTVTPSAPAYNPNTGRNPNTTPNAGTTTPSAPAYNPNAGNSNGGAIAPNPNAYTPSRGSYNPGNGSVNPNSSGTGNVPNNSPAYQPRTPQPSVPASNPPRDVFSPRNGGNSGGGGSTGGGGGGGGRRR